MNKTSCKPMRSRRFILILSILQILTVGAVSVFLPSQMFGQGTDSKPPTQSYSPGIEILTPTPGIDFSPYVNHLFATVKKNWYARMPESAKLGESGRVVLRLKIQKDGTLLSPPPLYQTPTIETSSGKEVLDKAAVTAILDSGPFEHLPDSFHGPYIELRVTFLYNHPPPSPYPYRKGPQL
jgi:TonB C terminal